MHVHMISEPLDYPIIAHDLYLYIFQDQVRLKKKITSYKGFPTFHLQLAFLQWPSASDTLIDIWVGQLHVACDMFHIDKARDVDGK